MWSRVRNGRRFGITGATDHLLYLNIGSNVVKVFEESAFDLNAVLTVNKCTKSYIYMFLEVQSHLFTSELIIMLVPTSNSFFIYQNI